MGWIISEIFRKENFIIHLKTNDPKLKKIGPYVDDV
jgi:hypothetical protein